MSDCIRLEKPVKASPKSVSVMIEWADGDKSAFRFEHIADAPGLVMEMKPLADNRTEFSLTGPLVDAVKTLLNQRTDDKPV